MNIFDSQIWYEPSINRSQWRLRTLLPAAFLLATVSVAYANAPVDLVTAGGFGATGSVTLVETDQEGPYTKNVAGVPNASVFDTTFTIEANVDDTNKGNSNIARAEFLINYWGGGLVEDWTDMVAADGAFDSPIEDVTYEFLGGLEVGEYEICVRGYDAGDNMGNTSCSRFVTFDPFGGERDLTFQLSNECALFYTLENEGGENEITTLHYGENIVFDTDLRANLNLTISDSGNVNFAFSLKGNGQGYGVTSGILYNFMLNSVLRAKTDINDFDPSIFTFKVKGRIVGQAQEVDGYGILNGAQNNAELFFTLRIHYANGRYTTQAYDFGVECAGDPWANLMENKDRVTRKPVERGFGDEQEKYGWSGADFNDHLVVGTKSAYYNLLTYLNGDGNFTPLGISWCFDDFPAPLPPIYKRLLCLELFGGPADRDANGAELWSLSYKNKRWVQAYNAEVEVVPGGGGDEKVQGFRAMEVYGGKLYVAGDLGASLSGVSFVNPGRYPGVALFVSEDGINFDLLTCAAALCNEGDDSPIGINTSIRSMAVWDDKLWIGTFNVDGGQIWTYDGSDFEQVYQNSDFPTVAELQPYGDYLYIALGGANTYDNAPNNNYLYRCEVNCVDSGTAQLAVVPDLPNIDESTLTVIELFTGVNKLFVGTINFEHGASLISYDEAADIWDVIVDGFPDGGMFDDDNVYFWAGGAIADKVCVGTFNTDLITEIPRGGAELYCSPDGVDWRQEPLSIGWSVLGYGIRNIIVGNDGKTMYLLSATNLLAPDLIPFDNPLRAGLEVWSIRDVKIDPPGKGKGKP